MRIRLTHLPVELPDDQSPRGPLINVMPIGLLALADRLDRDGHDVEVVHAGVEARLDPAYDPVDDLLASDADLVGFALHWHPQLGPVGRAVSRLQRHRPELPVVLGGMTASAFAEPLLKEWPSVRAVITGEGEVPLSALAARMEAGQDDWSGLPNVVFRGPEGKPIRSAERYVATRRDMDALEFCRLELLRHAEAYNGQFARGPHGWSHPPVFYLSVGRGCTVDCAFCSGGRGGHRRLAGRREVVFRSVSRVLEDLRSLAARSIDTVAVCFDPPGVSEPYYLELFEAVACSELRAGLVFECYQPPSNAFLEAFARAFPGAGSRLSFSPTVEDEALRARLLGVRYSNRELERALAECRRLGIPSTLYFAIVPQETPDQMDASLEWQRRLTEATGCRLIHAPIEAEPEAPWTRAPGRGGLLSARQGLASYLERHGPKATYGVRFRDEVGYAFPDVDARVVRAASALLDPIALAATALATCGAGVTERMALVAAERLPAALDLLGGVRGTPIALLLSTENAPGPWEGLEELAERLGPQVRRAVCDPRRIGHRLWKGTRVPEPPDPGELTVLHLADALAAQRGLGMPLDRLGPRTVLAELCRFSRWPCPATRLGFVSLGREGNLRCCPSSPDLGEGSLPELLERLREGHAQSMRSRGCDRCPVASSCSRCLFTGRLSPEQFCAIRRRLGPFVWPGAQTLLGRFAQPAGVAIGWDG